MGPPRPPPAQARLRAELYAAKDEARSLERASAAKTSGTSGDSPPAEPHVSLFACSGLQMPEL